ncbi:MAG TPA: CBS domain-containing protein [Candidatus Nanoarchaeia archaeon]|nr:CBS domain-containing protein [Candidatus Nanoarchaeia archaeon]
MKKSRLLLSQPIKNIMERKFLVVNKNQIVSEVHNLLIKKSNLFEVMDYIYVLGTDKKLVGVFSIKDLFRFPSNTKVESFMITKIISAQAKTETEKVAHIALRHEIKAIPIVENEKLIGVVSSKNILKIIHQSSIKDRFHFAGIHNSHLDYANTMQAPVIKSVIHRAPWLISGLIGILSIAAFIGIFENTLKENLILAFFIPVIVYICGALCTQIETLLVRDLAVMGKDLKIHKYIIKQGIISIIIALMISALLFLMISIFWQEKEIASVISLAAFLSLTLTTFTSFIIILGIKKLGGDPALGGGPFGTVISDSLAIIVYLLVANAFL